MKQELLESKIKIIIHNRDPWCAFNKYKVKYPDFFESKFVSEKNKNMTKVNTPFGIVSKLKDGSYRLRNSSNSIVCLKENEESTFHFLVDVGFVIKSYQYILKTENGYKKLNLIKLK